MHPSEVEVRLADGRIGVIPRAEFEGPGPIPLGETIEAALLARDDPKQRAVLSLSWARKQQAWERVDAAKASGEPITGKITKVVKGGLVVDVGLRGFLPTSLIADSPGTDPSTLVGTEAEVLVMEVDRASDRIVVSIRDLERRRRRAKEKEALKALAPGATANGRVVSVADYGAVVDLGGVRGLVHRSELTWGRLEKVEDIVSVGDRIDVVVLDVNKSKKRISLSLRGTTPDPLTQAEVGSIESATVVRVVEYGVFAQLDSSGAEGLVHITELSDVPGLPARTARHTRRAGHGEGARGRQEASSPVAVGAPSARRRLRRRALGCCIDTWPPSARWQAWCCSSGRLAVAGSIVPRWAAAARSPR